MSVEAAFSHTLSLLKGSYAIALLDGENSDVIYVGKNKSPLLIGLAEEANVIASDAMAMLQITKQFLEIMDEEYVILKRCK